MILLTKTGGPNRSSQKGGENMAEKIDKSSVGTVMTMNRSLRFTMWRPGERTILKEFDYLIRGAQLVAGRQILTYNSDSRIFKFDLETKESCEVFTDFVTNCNNDHVLSPEGSRIAVSHGTKEDGKSRIYTVPLTGGVPRLITPLAPSYLHGWSPDGRNARVLCRAQQGS